jgi:hypothetical protein
MANFQGDNAVDDVKHSPVVAHIIALKKFRFLGLALYNGKVIGLFEAHPELQKAVDDYESIFNPLRNWPKGRRDTPGPVPFSLPPDFG